MVGIPGNLPLDWQGMSLLQAGGYWTRATGDQRNTLEESLKPISISNDTRHRTALLFETSTVLYLAGNYQMGKSHRTLEIASQRPNNPQHHGQEADCRLERVGWGQGRSNILIIK
jgi:hypothetical protein